ncbi:MAG: HEAT repeat domain-containing protein [Chloroflexi bacterium]|nr:HEAT repeat domain-containing protein [Chloroflexota bacterium]
MLEVFVSHSTLDKKYTQMIKDKLHEFCFLWISSDFLRTGVRWSADIDDKLNTSDAVIVVLTSNSVRLPWVTCEWSFALGRRIPVLPLKFENIDENQTPVHDKLKELQFAPFLDPGPDDWEKLRDELLQQTRRGALDRIGSIASRLNRPGLSHSEHYASLLELNSVRDRDTAFLVSLREVLIKSALEDESDMICSMSVEVLSRTKARANFDVFIKILKSEEHYSVRSAAAKALGRLGDRRAAPELTLSLHDNPYVRNAAISALGDIHDGLDHLKPFLSDANPHTVLFTLRAISKFRSAAAEAVPQVIELLHDNTPIPSGDRICDAAAMCLRLIRDPRGLYAVRQWELEQLP